MTKVPAKQATIDLPLSKKKKKKLPQKRRELLIENSDHISQHCAPDSKLPKKKAQE
jgi:hypothetical protein